MRKLSWILGLFFLVVACKDNKPVEVETQSEKGVFNYQKLPKRTALNEEATALTESWPEFMIFNTSFDVLYSARNNEDLALAIDDLIEKEITLGKSEYPGLLDAFQVKSRQQVVKTYLLKVKAHILNNSETTGPTIEMLNAYNAMRKQFNVVLNSQLDENLILDEN
ncbi:hypothetical protein M3P19_11065 [Muricauda sp. 2012CJ35-5]|uniref:Uncharacterized protein n=1 Tax=Flagellimonas spongiicola TaxID=2942208 RepID=A0ABT0PV16_9FLAO|nr:hypothetical protein [Allomuricauda spongiicola]MCL6274552.1 hypothetical protein [Allomuricauda spongiicola]